MIRPTRPTLAVTGSTGPVARPGTRRCRSRPLAYDDHDLAPSALAGVETLFMVSGAEAVDRLAQHRAFVDAAAESGVQPEALTFTEIAAILSAGTDRTVTFHDETLEEAYASRRRWPAEQWEYDAWVSTYTAVARGELAAVSGDVRLLTGREPVSLETLLTDAPRTA